MMGLYWRGHKKEPVMQPKLVEDRDLKVMPLLHTSTSSKEGRESQGSDCCSWDMTGPPPHRHQPPSWQQCAGFFSKMPP